jgi:hypothetical protein
MTPTEESRLLKAVLKHLEAARTPRPTKWLMVAGWFALVVALFVLLQFVPTRGSWRFAFAGIACFIGMLSTFFLVYVGILKQWPVLAPFVDKEAIARRLADLKHNNSLERTREG